MRSLKKHVGKSSLASTEVNPTILLGIRSRTFGVEMRIKRSCTALMSSAAIDHANGFQRGVTHNLQAPGAQLVERVLNCVVEDVVVAVVEVNDVDAGHAAFHKWQVIVFNRACARVEV